MPTTSACRPRFTIPTAVNRCGVTRSRPSCTASCVMRWATFPLQISGALGRHRLDDWIARRRFMRPKFQPHFFYFYLPHLDYAAQKFGPGQREGRGSTGELDAVHRQLATASCRPTRRRTDCGWWPASTRFSPSITSAIPTGSCAKRAAAVRERTTANCWIWQPAEPGAWSTISFPTCSCARRSSHDRAGRRAVHDTPGIGAWWLVTTRHRCDPRASGK